MAIDNKARPPLLLFFLLSFLSNATAQELRYQETGSASLEYQADYKMTETQTVTRRFIRLDQERLEEDKKSSTRWRKNSLTRSIRRQALPPPYALVTRVVSIVQGEEGDGFAAQLPTQRIAEYSESQSGLPAGPFAIDAIAYFGIPLPLSQQVNPAGAPLMAPPQNQWSQNWTLLLENGIEIPINGQYRIERSGLLAGHECVFVAYELKDSSQPNEWQGAGIFAFDFHHGYPVAHRGRFVRTTNWESFAGNVQTITQTETVHEIGEALNP